MKPSKWGPIFWEFFHCLLYLYDKDQKNTLSNFLYKDFPRLIPCGSCRKHYISIIQQTPPPYHSEEEMIAWGFSVHNAVNEKLGKPVLAHEQLFQKYKRKFFDTKADIMKRGVVNGVVITTGVILLSFLLSRYWIKK